MKDVCIYTHQNRTQHCICHKYFPVFHLTDRFLFSIRHYSFAYVCMRFYSAIYWSCNAFFCMSVYQIGSYTYLNAHNNMAYDRIPLLTRTRYTCTNHWRRWLRHRHLIGSRVVCLFASSISLDPDSMTCNTCILSRIYVNGDMKKNCVCEKKKQKNANDNGFICNSTQHTNSHTSAHTLTQTWQTEKNFQTK